MIYWQRRGNKFNAKSCMYNGVLYHSKREAGKAADLDLLVKAGEIKSWTRQVKIPLDVNGYHICNYICDFKVVHNNKSVEFIEVKGYWTPVARLKAKMFKAIYPKAKYTISD